MTSPDDFDPGPLERELLGGERRYTRLEVAERSGVSIERCTEFWHALGFADVADDVCGFTDRDVWAVRTVTELGDAGWLPEDMQVSMARALGQSLSRLADWQLGTIGTMLDPATAPGEAMRRAEELVPVVEQLIGYVWRRHLAAAAGRLFATNSEELDAGTIAVGFADMVGFTTLTREIGEDELGELVERFEGLSSNIIAMGGGRVIKTIGDEVLFVADDVGTAAEIGVGLAEQIPHHSALPELRVGMAYGTVLSRLGDVYGEPVNIASRLTSIARPGSVLVDRDFAEALEGNEAWRTRRVPPRPVRGYAMLQPLRLRRAEAERLRRSESS